MKVIDISKYDNDLITYVNELQIKCANYERLQRVIDKSIKYIKEHCIDDECYINLTNKEKNIYDVLNILQGDYDFYN